MAIVAIGSRVAAASRVDRAPGGMLRVDDTGIAAAQSMTRCTVVLGQGAAGLRGLHAIGAVLLALMLALGACAPTIDRDVRLAGIGTARAAPDPKPVPHFTETSFVAADGVVLPARRWLPQGQVPAVILALHGINDYSHAFAMPAAVWASRGIATYAYDQRGFGGAPGRGYWPGRAALAADAASAAAALRRLYPGVPLYLLGESMGGAVAIVAMTGESGTPVPDVDGVILSAPAVWGRAAMPFVPKLALWGGVRLFPGMTLTGRQLKIEPSDNEAMLRELSRDPLVIKATRVDTIYGLVDLMDAALAAAPRLNRRVLLMYGAHDEIVPRLSVREFVTALRPDAEQRPRLAYYEHGYHMLLRDLEGPLVAEDVAGWVLDGKAPLASHADFAEDDRPWPPSARPEAPTLGELAPAAPKL
jgi:acylglycerol lipase